MLWVPVVILAGVLVGALGLQFFIGWRAASGGSKPTHVRNIAVTE
jgi:hypothetical protein